jgi:hypothetical protein
LPTPTLEMKKLIGPLAGRVAHASSSATAAAARARVRGVGTDSLPGDGQGAY